MINSLIGSLMNMTADILIQQNSQNSSGTISRQWIYHTTIPCKVEPLGTGGALGRADNKIFDAEGANNAYSERFQLKMKSPIALSRRYRVTSIRSSDGTVVYKEIDKLNTPDMIFDVTANHAELDPFGKIHYYETTLQRVLVQKNDTSSSNS